MPHTIQDNFRAHTITAVVLCLCFVLGSVESFLWGRTALDDLVPLWITLLLLFYDHFNHSWRGTVSRGSRISAWATLLIAAGFMFSGIVLAKCSALQTNGHLSKSIGSTMPMALRNTSLALLAVSIMLHRSGWCTTARNWMLPTMSLVIVPFYELLLLEFSFPLRLLSTNIAVGFLRLLSFNISSNGTTLFWQGNELAITDACSGISLLGLLILVAYWLIRKINAPAWQKYCWFSMLLIWVLLSNTLRLLLTLFGYILWGDTIFANVPHFILGCLFVVTSSLLLWFSNIAIFKSDSKHSEPNQPAESASIITSSPNLIGLILHSYPTSRIVSFTLLISAILSFVPLLLEMPYVFTAMKTSPLESWNYIFLLLAAIQIAFTFFMGHRNGKLMRSGKLNIICVLFILFSLACLIVSWHKHIHFALLISATCLSWSVICAAFSWSTAYTLLPAFAMFILGIPSTGFLLGNAMAINGLAAKSILAGIFLVLTPITTNKYLPKPSALIYTCACLIIASCYGIKVTSGRLAPALVLSFNNLSANGFNGTNMEISDADRDFYGASDIQRYLFIDPKGNAIHVLDVAKVANIHAIHPMAYCLRASGFILESEQTISITIGGRQVFIHEITTSRGETRSIHWQWYSTPEHSTANFLLFRGVYSPKEDWRMTQISTRIDGTAEDSRTRLLQFANAFISAGN